LRDVRREASGRKGMMIDDGLLVRDLHYRRLWGRWGGIRMGYGMNARSVTGEWAVL
jgi:hypothetical protein